MTETLPPLTVRVDRAGVIAARKRERRIAIIGGSVEFVVAAAMIAGALWITAQGATFDGFGVIFLGILALGSALFGGALLGSLRKKGAEYWNAEGLPEVAFVVHGAGVTITNPESSETIEAPWASVKAFDAKRLYSRFRFAPGVVEAKYRNQFAFGRATLDQDAATIRRALTALSGRPF